MSSLPVVRGLPVVGSLRDLQTTRLRRFLTRAHLEHGPVVEIRVLGQPLVVLSGLEVNRFVAGPGRRKFGSRQAWGRLDRHFGVARSLISTDGPEHAAIKRIEGPAYTRAHFNDTFDRSAAIVLADVDAVRPGRLVVGSWTKLLVTEQVAAAVVHGTARPLQEQLVRYVQTALMSHVTAQLPPQVMKLPRVARAQRASWAMAEDLLDERRRTGPADPPDLIDHLLAASGKDPASWGPADLRLGVIGAFIAGMDTAANSLAFVLWELTRHPELVPALVEEVDAAFADGIRVEALEQMPRLVAFVHEVLRLHPIAPALTRELLEDIEVAGHHLPAGTRVIVATTVTHGLPDLFPDPWRFDPERYGPERGEHRNPGAFVPFGVGTHICAGRGMAEGLLFLDAAVLLHRLRFTGVPGYRLREIARPTPSPDERFHLDVQGHRAVA